MKLVIKSTATPSHLEHRRNIALIQLGLLDFCVAAEHIGRMVVVEKLKYRYKNDLNDYDGRIELGIVWEATLEQVLNEGCNRPSKKVRHKDNSHLVYMGQ